ncbi:MAG: hypothetical protein ACK5L9_23760 [Paracoccus sp. (in: a-proteobacteria)]
MRSRDLAALERIARLKAERELKKFAAFRQHMEVARQKVDAAQVSLEQSYRSVAPLTVAAARMANAQAGRSARDLRHAQQELQRLKPRFEAVRKDAMHEFGRAEVLLDLSNRKPRDEI